MKVILDAADDERRAIPLLEDSSLIGEQRMLDFA
jgi:hypothetical protein